MLDNLPLESEMVDYIEAQKTVLSWMQGGINHDYEKKVCKIFIEILESKGIEVMAEFYTILLQNGVPLHKFRLLTYIDMQETLHPLQIRCERSPKLVGLIPWESGYFLAQYLLSTPSILAAKTVIELGAGIGITGISLASFTCLSSLLLTDFEDLVLENLRHNVDLNKKAIKAPTKVEKLDWADSDTLPGNFDVILAADCVYDVSVLSCFVKLVAKLVKAKEGSFALLAQSKRNEKTFKRFEDECKETQLKITEIKFDFLGCESKLFVPVTSLMMTHKPDYGAIRLFKISSF